MDELDGDVLGIRAPSTVAERDQLAAFPDLAAMAAPTRLMASAQSTKARPASGRRAKASATAPDPIGPDYPPPTPFTDAPQASRRKGTIGHTPIDAWPSC
jgi:hypothetical protein